MAPILKGIVAIAVEDDAILMIHGTVRIDDMGCHDVSFSPLQSVARPHFVPSQDEMAEGLDAEKLNTVGMITHWLNKFVGECIEQGDPVDGIGISVFGNVIQDSQMVFLSPSPWHGIGIEKAIAINFPQSLRELYSTFERDPENKNPIICIDNDATAMAIGEFIRVGKRPKLFSCIWLGKGVNIGLVSDEVGSWRGFMHPEAGHFLPRLHPIDKEFTDLLADSANPTSCTVHRDCLVGLVSQNSILNRKNIGMDDKDITAVVADYIAQLCVAVTYITAPGQISIGGHTLRSKLLDENEFIEAVRDRFRSLINGHPKYSQIADENVDKFITRASGDDTSALLGVKERLKVELLNVYRRGSFSLAGGQRLERVQ